MKEGSTLIFPKSREVPYRGHQGKDAVRWKPSQLTLSSPLAFPSRLNPTKQIDIDVVHIG